VFSKVVVPVDFSEASKVAVQYAVKLVQGSGAELILLHVVQPVVPTETPTAFVPQGGPATPLREEMTVAREDMARLAPMTASVKTRSVMRTGEPGSEIVGFAREEAADLIVMTTHGRSGLSRLLLGSVTESVMRHSDVPLMTLRQPRT
jgi:nucleotide-binding universal stress UspA family protein